MSFDSCVSHNSRYLKRYKEQDEYGRYFWDTFARPGLKNPINYDINTDDGNIINGDWIWSKTRFLESKSKGQVRVLKKENGDYTVHFKQYLNLNGKKPRSMTSDFGGTYDGKKEIGELLESDKIFSYPKSTKQILKLMEFIKIQSDEITLDFFSGSATTAHAIMQLNSEDGGNRKYIMVQLPEPCDVSSEAFKAGYKNICEIGKERIRRAGKKIVSSVQCGVDSDSRKEEMKKYGCKELPRVDCVAEVNASGESGLHASEETSQRGDVRTFRPNEESCGIHSIEHSRGTSTNNQGVSSLSEHCSGVESRIGDTATTLRTGELPCRYGHFGSDATATGDKQDDKCSFKNTIHCPLTTPHSLDIGFKVLKLDSSNIKEWDPLCHEDLENQLLFSVDNIKKERTAEDVLYEIFIKYGLELTVPWRVEMSGEKHFFVVGAGNLIVCLENTITRELIQQIIEYSANSGLPNPTLILKELGLGTDTNKTNILQQLKQAKIEDVKCV